MASDAAAPTGPTLPLGKGVFIDDVPGHMKDKQADEVIVQLQQQLAQYKMIEQEIVHRRQRLQAKLPEVQLSLDAVNALLERKGEGEELRVDFELADGVFAAGAVQDVDSVNLWLGAGVMVEYPLQEAADTLQSKRDLYKKNIDTLGSELELVRAAATTSEVNVARVFNWDVERRRAAKQAGGEDS